MESRRRQKGVSDEVEDCDNDALLSDNGESDVHSVGTKRFNKWRVCSLVKSNFRSDVENDASAGVSNISVSRDDNATEVRIDPEPVNINVEVSHEHRVGPKRERKPRSRRSKKQLASAPNDPDTAIGHEEDGEFVAEIVNVDSVKYASAVADISNKPRIGGKKHTGAISLERNVSAENEDSVNGLSLADMSADATESDVKMRAPSPPPPMDPWQVPTVGQFYLHDTRSSGRGRGRGRGNFGGGNGGHHRDSDRDYRRNQAINDDNDAKPTAESRGVGRSTRGVARDGVGRISEKFYTPTVNDEPQWGHDEFDSLLKDYEQMEKDAPRRARAAAFRARGSLSGRGGAGRGGLNGKPNGVDAVRGAGDKKVNDVSTIHPQPFQPQPLVQPTQSYPSQSSFQQSQQAFMPPPQPAALSQPYQPLSHSPTQFNNLNQPPSILPNQALPQSQNIMLQQQSYQEFLATAYAAYAAGVPLSSQSTFVEPQAPVLPHQESASRIKPSVAEMNEIGSLEPLAGEQHGLLGDQPTLQPSRVEVFAKQLEQRAASVRNFDNGGAVPATPVKLASNGVGLMNANAREWSPAPIMQISQPRQQPTSGPVLLAQAEFSQAQTENTETQTVPPPSDATSILYDSTGQFVPSQAMLTAVAAQQVQQMLLASDPISGSSGSNGYSGSNVAESMTPSFPQASFQQAMYPQGHVLYPQASQSVFPTQQQSFPLHQQQPYMTQPSYQASFAPQQQYSTGQRSGFSQRAPQQSFSGVGSVYGTASVVPKSGLSRPTYQQAMKPQPQSFGQYQQSQSYGANVQSYAHAQSYPSTQTYSATQPYSTTQAYATAPSNYGNAVNYGNSATVTSMPMENTTGYRHPYSAPAALGQMGSTYSDSIPTQSHFRMGAYNGSSYAGNDSVAQPVSFGSTYGNSGDFNSGDSSRMASNYYTNPDMAASNFNNSAGTAAPHYASSAPMQNEMGAVDVSRKPKKFSELSRGVE